ncbi:MAG: methyltransferase domain-containing protein [Acidiferrobacterales bacterium]
MDWFDSPLGLSLQACEANRLRSILPSLYASNAVQLGRLGNRDLFESCTAPRRILLDIPIVAGDCTVQAAPEALPFEHNSIDMALLPHTLDFSIDPHQVLREVERVLMPESHVVILGFNPLSFWGLKRKLTRKRNVQTPWNGQFISLYRIKDWLKLLQFEITHGGMMYYRPPFQNQATLDRSYFLDKIGDRWWPMMGAVYVLVARKRVEGMTPIKPRWKLRVIPNGNGVTEPATRGIVTRKWIKKTDSG